MPQYWQVTQARAHQTHGVWTLDAGFTVAGTDIMTHDGATSALLAAATLTEDKKNTLDTQNGDLGVEYDFFKSMNTAIAARLDSEVPDDHPLQKDIDQIRLIPSNRSRIEERTLKTCAAWEKVNDWLAAKVPPLPAVTLRGTTAAAYRTRWLALPGKRNAQEVAEADWRTSLSELRIADRLLDRMNKDWYQAWKSEYPPGTPEGDALAGVDTETGTSLPQILQIAAIVQEGLSLRVTYVPGTGQHATVLDLNYLVEGVHGDFQRVTAEVDTGNLIGPFTEGQIVRIRTDVGNSRDNSELSPEQALTITAAP